MNTVKGFVHIRFSFAMYIMGFSWPSQKHRKSKVYNNSSKTFFICFFWAKYLILLSIRTAPLVVNHEESSKQHLIKKTAKKKNTPQKAKRKTTKSKSKSTKNDRKAKVKTTKKDNQDTIEDDKEIQPWKGQRNATKQQETKKTKKKTIIQGWVFYWYALKVSDYM